jgi:hypothetical protein
VNIARFTKAIRISRMGSTTLSAGSTAGVDNLAYACLRCNAWKGSDVGSINPLTGAFVSLFHPRRRHWDDHFVLRGSVIHPVTAAGEATARLLKLNLDKRTVARQLLAAAQRYPR